MISGEKPAARSCRSGKWPELDILEPAWAAVILKADIAAPGVFFVGDVELVGAAVGALVGLGPLIEVHTRDHVSVQLDADPLVVAGDDDVVPLAHGLHGGPR